MEKTTKKTEEGDNFNEDATLEGDNNSLDVTPDELIFSSKEEKYSLLNDTPSHLLPYFQKFIWFFLEKRKHQSMNISIKEISEELTIYLDILGYIRNNIDSLKVQYILKEHGVTSFTELKEMLNITDNKTFTRKIKKLKDKGDIKSVDISRDDVRHRSDVLQVVAKRKTSSYYELNNNNKELLLDEEYISNNLKEDVKQRKISFKKNEIEYAKIKRDEALKIKDKNEKKKTKFVKIKEVLEQYIGEKMAPFDFFRIIYFREEIVGSRKKAEEWGDELIRSGIIKRLHNNDGELFLILDFMDKNDN